MFASFTNADKLMHACTHTNTCISSKSKEKKGVTFFSDKGENIAYIFRELSYLSNHENHKMFP